MKKIPLMLLALTAMLIPGVAASTISVPQAESAAAPSCSSSTLYLGAGTFTVCVSRSTLHPHQSPLITMSVTNPSSSGGNLLFYGAVLSISNSGNPVFSAVQRCPSQFSCPVASGQTYTVTFSWTVTPPTGTDNVLGTVYWDYGCRVFGCLVIAPPPSSTQVSITVK